MPRVNACAITLKRSTYGHHWIASIYTHDPTEWDPVVVKGQRCYPSKEEAEYTAPLAFAVAVALSWWAARTGRATLHVPRMPMIQCHGRREHWLAYDPRAMREWAICEVLLKDNQLPAHHMYVGRGHHSHRLRTTIWKSPVTPGHDCPMRNGSRVFR